MLLVTDFSLKHLIVSIIKSIRPASLKLISIYTSVLFSQWSLGMKLYCITKFVDVQSQTSFGCIFFNPLQWDFPCYYWRGLFSWHQSSCCCYSILQLDIGKKSLSVRVPGIITFLYRYPLRHHQEGLMNRSCIHISSIQCLISHISPLGLLTLLATMNMDGRKLSSLLRTRTPSKGYTFLYACCQSLWDINYCSCYCSISGLITMECHASLDWDSRGCAWSLITRSIPVIPLHSREATME